MDESIKQLESKYLTFARDMYVAIEMNSRWILKCTGYERQTTMAGREMEEGRRTFVILKLVSADDARRI